MRRLQFSPTVAMIAQQADVARRHRTKAIREVRRALPAHFKVAVSSLMQRPAEAASAAGRWVDIDTSFVDIPDDFEAPKHTKVFELLAASPIGLIGEASQQERMRELALELVAVCKKFVTMDRDGMFEVAVEREMNSGPAYEEVDRRLKRRRMWYAVREAFESCREHLWLSDAEGKPTQQLLPAKLLYEVTSWYQSAESQRVRSRLHYENTPDSLYEESDLRREAACLMRAIRDDGGGSLLTYTDRATDETGASLSVEDRRKEAVATVDRVLRCFTLCDKYGMPFEWTTSPTGSSAIESLLQAVATSAAVMAAWQALAVLRIVADSSAFDVGVVSTPQSAPVLVQLLRTAVADTETLDTNDVLTFLKVLMKFKDNSTSDLNSSDSHRALSQSLEAVERRVISRCRALLYNSARGVDIVKEDSLVPAVHYMKIIAEQQAASDSGIAKLDGASRRAMMLHHKLHVRSAEGITRHQTHGGQSAHLAHTMQELQNAGSLQRGADHVLLRDLVDHFGTTLAKGYGAATMDGVLRVLQLPADSIASSARAAQILSGIDSVVGREIAAVKTLRDLVIVVKGFANTGHVPSCLGRLELLCLRLLLKPAEGTIDISAHSRDVADLVIGLGQLGSSASVAFQQGMEVLLQNAALDKKRPVDDDVLHCLLEAAAALPAPAAAATFAKVTNAVGKHFHADKHVRAALLSARIAPLTACLFARADATIATLAVASALDVAHIASLDHASRALLVLATADLAGGDMINNNVLLENVFAKLDAASLPFMHHIGVVSRSVHLTSEAFLKASGANRETEAQLAAAADTWQTALLARLKTRRSADRDVALRLLRAVDAVQGESLLFREDLQQLLMMRAAL